MGALAGRGLLRADHHVDLSEGGGVRFPDVVFRPGRRGLVLDVAAGAYFVTGGYGGAVAVDVCGMCLADEPPGRHSDAGVRTQLSLYAARVYLGVLPHMVGHPGRSTRKCLCVRSTAYVTCADASCALFCTAGCRQGVHLQAAQGVQHLPLQRHRHGAEPSQPPAVAGRQAGQAQRLQREPPGPLQPSSARRKPAPPRQWAPLWAWRRGRRRGRKRGTFVLREQQQHAARAARDADRNPQVCEPRVDGRVAQPLSTGHCCNEKAVLCGTPPTSAFIATTAPDQWSCKQPHTRR